MPKVGEWTVEKTMHRKMRFYNPIPETNTSEPDLYIMQFKGGSVRYRVGTWDPWTSVYEFDNESDVREKFWYPNIKKGDVVVDAGAGWGAYVLTAAALGAKVYAFEPDHRIFNDLQTNVQENGFDCVLHCYGLGNTNDIMEYEDFTMWVRRLDDIGLPPINYLKIDTDGQELDTIKGALRTIAKYRPRLLVEMHLGYDPLIIKKITQLLDGYKLRIYKPIPDPIWVYYEPT